MDIFLTSPWIPPEWVKAHGLEPRGIWSAPGFGRHPAPMGAGTCGFAQSVLQMAESESSSAVIFTSHCDQLRRAFDTVPGPATPRTFLFNLPATTQTSLGAKIFYAELERLGNFLVRQGGRRPLADELKRFMLSYDQARESLLAAAPWCQSTRFAETIRQFCWDGSCRLPDRSGSASRTNGAPVPVALIGGPLAADQLMLLDLIENLGGRVVLNATEPGERMLAVSQPPVEAPQTASENDSGVSLPSLMKLLAQRFSESCVDAFLRPNDRLYEWLRTRLAARKVRGILLCCYGGCDLWRAEAQTLRETFRLPLLLLEAELGGGLDRYQGRIEAFMEALR